MGDVIIERDGPITTIRLNRPHALNAMTHRMHYEIDAALSAFADDAEASVAVITGNGDRAFCAGSDLKDPDLEKPYPTNGYAGLIERYDLSKPVIAAVNGFALGGGFEIALACDIIVAADTASFGLPEPLVGGIALGGGLQRLPRQIGMKPAMGLILTGRRVSASEGLQLGFVNEVVPFFTLEQAVARWCQDILRASPVALRASKQTVMRGLAEPSLADAMRLQGSLPAFQAWKESADIEEGPRAFAEKRLPRWTNAKRSY